MNISKQEVVEACVKHIQNQIDRLQAELKELQQSNEQNTKSSAGDKHETARAMVHLEIEKLSNQLNIAELVLSDLHKINVEHQAESVQKGSVIETNRGTFLIGASTGKVMLDKGFLFGVSMDSPLAKALLGKKVKDQITLNGNQFTLLDLH